MDNNRTIQLLSLFYAHKLHVNEACKTPETPSDAMMNLCHDIIDGLKSVYAHDIIEILKQDHEAFDIEAADIPQFSDFDMCAYRTPYLVLASRQKDISYAQMGFMLLRSPKKEGAYFKYGENQAKTAAQIGLCHVKRGKINASYLGLAFCALTQEEQKKILPKLLLFVPIVQNYFVADRSQELIDSYFSSLSESTQKRRIGNVRTLIQIVEKQLEDEL